MLLIACFIWFNRSGSMCYTPTRQQYEMKGVALFRIRVFGMFYITSVSSWLIYAQGRIYHLILWDDDQRWSAITYQNRISFTTWLMAVKCGFCLFQKLVGAILRHWLADKNNAFTELVVCIYTYLNRYETWIHRWKNKTKRCYTKQNRSTEGCSKLKRYIDMTSSGKNGLNIRTNASPK